MSARHQKRDNTKSLTSRLKRGEYVYHTVYSCTSKDHMCCVCIPCAEYHVYHVLCTHSTGHAQAVHEAVMRQMILDAATVVVLRHGYAL